ncbi:MAG TPA: hypothetical protein VFE62_22595 [Gemmataceae bacterium]|nr:hypothetical protein [Gemmataceae bacterium]
MRKLAVLWMCLFAGGLALLDAQAQEPAGAIFFQHRQFKIPFKNDQRGLGVTQIRLYVSNDQGRTWQVAATAAPEEQAFRFSTPQDGFFYFAVQTVDRKGTLDPPKVENLRPNLRVIVDTTPPSVRAQALAPRGADVGVSWTVHDENLDLALPDALRVEYRFVGAAAWIPLAVPAGQTQVYWNPHSNNPIEVRVSARDRAGNIGEDKVLVNQGGGGGGNNFGQPFQPFQKQIPQQDALNLERKFVGSKQISLSYDLRDVGPSGVSSVELWYTLYQGRAWNKLTEYPIDLKNLGEGNQPKKLTFEVNDEGIYGITLVAKSGVGLGERAPQLGDRPQFWMEVDLTKPLVQVQDVHVGTGFDKGKLTIQWNARDKNLGPNPIRISYAEQREGPWTTIAEKLSNSGRHVWKMPEQLPFQFFLRVEAVDLAGNVGEAMTQERVKVDLSMPKAQPLNIEPGGR